MKILSLMLLAVGLPLGSFAGNITTLFNTGVNSSGALLAAGSIDPHYTDTNSSHSVFVINQNGAWAGTGGAANYIAPDSSGGGSFGGGVYTLDYVTSFNLTGFDPSTVSITGLWSTDNFGNNILVNGNSTGNTDSGFSSLKSFTLSGASGLFTAGINTLDFQWGNSGGPGGLAVVFTSATASGVPEPATLVLFAAGLATLVVASRRNRSRQQN